MKKTIRKKLNQLNTNEKGFTLIEMTLVLFIISVLLLLIIPNISTHQGTAEETGDGALKTVVQTQIDLYEMKEGSLPESLDALAAEDYLSASQLIEIKESYTIDASGKLTEIVVE